jgi:RNA polymerase sigma-70 factor (sigma-E family)
VDSVDEDFSAFVTAHWDKLVGHAFLLMRDRGLAEDAVQCVLERCSQRWSSVRLSVSVLAYVRAAVTNEAVSRSRRRRFLEVSLTAVMDRPGADAYAAADSRHDLWVALGRLPPRMRAVLVLRYVDDLSARDVAAVLGCSVGSVKSQASRGLARLEGMLSAPVIAPGEAIVRSAPRPA